MRKIEIFSAGCAFCKEAVELVKRLACPSCRVEVLDLNDSEVFERAKALGIKRAPAVVIDGKLADCCSAGGIDEEVLKRLGVGTPLS